MKRSLATLLLVLSIGAGLPAQTPDLYDMTVVRSIKLTFKQSNWWTLLGQNKNSRTDIPADMEVDSRTYKDVGVRFRGNTSYSYNPSSQKKPFNIMTDAFVQGQRLYGYKNLNLANSYKDATFVREVIAYEVMRRYVPSLKANFIKLYLNNESWGIYINIEQSNRGFVGDWFRNTDGNLYRGDSERRNTRPTLTYLGTNPESYKSQYDINVENQTPWLDLIKLCDVLNNTSMNQLPQELPKVLNVDNALWYIALQNILSNTDSYLGTGNDYLAYHDVYHDRFMIMPWDLNTTFGGYDWRRLLGAQGLKVMSPYYKGSSSDKRPLITQLLAVPVWKERYLAHFRTMLDDFFKWEFLGPLVAKYQKLIENDVKADTKKLYATQLFYDNAITDVVVRDRYGSYTIPGLRSFVDTRRTYLLNHADIKKPAPAITDVTHTPARPRPSESVWVNARITGPVPVGTATLHYRVLGRFLEIPMYDDGQHNDGKAGDDVFGARIPNQAPAAEVHYYLSAASALVQGGAMTFNPRQATFQPLTYRVGWHTTPSDVKISEVLARNKMGIRDERGEREDWIELVNTGTKALQVSGYFLTDDLFRPTRWKIPTGYTIQPGKTLLIWADDEGSQGPLHAAFKLGGSGEEIALFDRDGKTLLDSVTFGPQQEDVSTGRLPGHPGVWASFPDPTPYRPNQPDPCGHLDYHGLDVTATPFSLTGVGSPVVGGQVSYKIGNAPASTPGFLALSLAPMQAGAGSLGAVLVNPALMVLFPVTTDGSGSTTQNLGIPSAAALKGQVFYFQAFVFSGTAGGFSSGVLTRICP